MTLEPDLERRPVRFAEPVFVWTVFGLLVAVSGPGLSMVVLGMGPEFALFVAGSLLAGLAGGVILGLVDPPGWVAGRSDPGEVVPRALLALIALLVLGAMWSGAAGFAGGLVLSSTIALIQGGPMASDGFALALLGGILGAGVGTPVVVVFGVIRGVGHLVGRPLIVSLPAALLVPTGAGLLGIFAMARLFGGTSPW
jgi:hypothetical protein